MTIHIIGAGLAGLNAALTLIDLGHHVALYEGAGQAGGRCRSWHDPVLDASIDNGTHMVVGGNREVWRYLKRIGATDRMVRLPSALPMLDLRDGRRWVAYPLTLLPTIAAAFWRLPVLPGQSVAQALGRSRHYQDFWAPLTVSVMNCQPEEASAALFRRVLARTLWLGQGASTPFLARNSLADSFVAPAIAAIEAAGGEITYHQTLRRIDWKKDRIKRLHFSGQTLYPSRHDQVILALPWHSLTRLLPDHDFITDLTARPIVNAHFRLPDDVPAPPPALGLLGGHAQWLFWRAPILSATVSDARFIADQSVEDCANLLWDDASKALTIKEKYQSVRIIKEHRATLLHDDVSQRSRPMPVLGGNCFLAGDWTDTGLPCTLESALKSGRDAANIATQYFHH